MSSSLSYFCNIYNQLCRLSFHDILSGRKFDEKIIHNTAERTISANNIMNMADTVVYV